MNEQILFYLLCADLNIQLNNILNMKLHQLKGKIGDITLSADIRRLRNDIKEVNRVAGGHTDALVKFLSTNYGCKFQFMIEGEKKPSGVDGKEIQITT